MPKVRMLLESLDRLGEVQDNQIRAHYALPRETVDPRLAAWLRQVLKAGDVVFSKWADWHDAA